MKQKYLILIGLFLFLFTVSLSVSFITAEDGEEGDDDSGGDLGVAAIALFSIGALYVIIFQIFLLSTKLPKDQERYVKFKKGMMEFHKKIRKPLSLLHYFAGIAALIILIIHGNALIDKGEDRAIYGIITASFLAFFVISGAIIKLLKGKSQVSKTLKKVLFKVHTNIIVFLIVVAIHLVHISR